MHYHLNRGGVTRIIESQVHGIRLNHSDIHVKILCGISSGVVNMDNVEIVEDCLLNYMPPDIPVEHLSKSVVSIISLIKSHLTNHTIIHSHNPNLGKNPALSVALYQIACDGIQVINHYHDFAEDRPVNMKLFERSLPFMTAETPASILYPALPGYHYIVLNSCDEKRLINKGVDLRQVHFLPNPVAEPGTRQKEITDLKKKVSSILGFESYAKLCCYPVRAIQRKNIGEFILMAVLFGEIAGFAITLAPLNPVEIPAYERWKSFCTDHSINIRFEAGDLVDYDELIAISDFCITTSIREGFGMIYMEPWLAGTSVIGRELPCVVTDLKKHGMQFPRLYKSFLVQTAQGMEDFKNLSEEEQVNLILLAMKSRDKRAEIFSSNNFLETWLDPLPEEIILNNSKIIRQNFSIEAYGKQLLGIYSEVSR